MMSNVKELTVDFSGQPLEIGQWVVYGLRKGSGATVGKGRVSGFRKPDDRFEGRMFPIIRTFNNKLITRDPRDIHIIPSESEWRNRVDGKEHKPKDHFGWFEPYKHDWATETESGRKSG